MILKPLKSQNFDGLQFPDLCFFQPKKLFLFKDNTLTIRYLNFVSDEVRPILNRLKRFHYKTIHLIKMIFKLNLEFQKNHT